MKTQTMHLGDIVVTYELGETWFDGSLRVVQAQDEAGQPVCIAGTDAIVALRNFLNSLDFRGRKLTLIK